MLWLSLLPFVTAFAYRFAINRNQTWGTPDERVYSTYAEKWRMGSIYRRFTDKFIAQATLEIPPTRYAFFLLCSSLVLIFRAKDSYRVVTWVAATSGAFLAFIAFQITRDLPSSLLVGSSPLSLMLSRRALQDTFAALTVLIGVYAVSLENPWLLGASIALMLATREALILYVPALALAWGVHTQLWLPGIAVISIGSGSAIGLFYLLGGRGLGAIFRKLRQSTDYVTRLQSGMPHRVLVDLAVISPVPLTAALIAAQFAPGWILSFFSLALATHAFITPKNVRFLLTVEIGLRLLCAWLPSPWNWFILGAGSVSDLFLYRAIAMTKDPVTYNLIVNTGMYQEK